MISFTTSRTLGFLRAIAVALVLATGAGTAQANGQWPNGGGKMASEPDAGAPAVDVEQPDDEPSILSAVLAALNDLLVIDSLFM